MIVTNFPPEPVRCGYRRGAHFIEFSDEHEEQFVNALQMHKRLDKAQKEYDAAVAKYYESKR